MKTIPSAHFERLAALADSSIKKGLSALVILSLLNVISASAQTVVVESRSGNSTTGTENPAFSHIGFSATPSSNKSTAPGCTTPGSSRFANSITTPPSFSVTPTLEPGTTYSVAITLGSNQTGNNGPSPTITATIDSTGTSSSAFASPTTAFQLGAGAANAWVVIGTILPNTANPTITFTYASGSLGGAAGRFFADSIRFVALPPTATPQYWDLNGNTVGIGGASGLWNVNALNWNLSADGSGVPQNYVATNLSVFGGTPGVVNIDAGGITTGGGLQFDVSGYAIQGGPLTLGTGTNITVTSAATTNAINAKISGTNGLNKAGLGTLLLGAANDLIGPTTISAGALMLGANQTFSGLAGSGGLALGSNALTNGDSTSSTFSGVISDTSEVEAGSLVKQGSGTFTLTGANNYHGQTRINEGTIAIAADSGLGTAPASATPDHLVLNNATLRNTAGMTLNARRGITIIGNCTLAGLTSPMVLASPIVGSGSLTVPNGWFDFNASNSFTGDLTFTVTANTSIRFNGDHSAGSGKIFVSPAATNQPMTLRNNGSGVVSTLTNDIQLNPGTGNLNFDSGSGSAVFTLSGRIDGAAPAFIHGNPNGQGTIVLSGDNSAYSGGFSLQGGTLSLGHKSALGTARLNVSQSAQVVGGNPNYRLQAATPLVGENAITNPITISVANGFAINGANALELSGPVTLGTSLEIANNNSEGTIFSGTVDDTGAARSLTLTGAGTLSLNGANSYTGPTTVSSGTLNVNGNTSSSAFSVANGATLGGAGTVGAVDLSGTISPGGSVGTLNSGNQNWNGGGHYKWQINSASGTAGSATGWDKLNITGTLNIAASGGSVFTIDLTSLTLAGAAGNVSDFNGGANYSWVIATAAGGITGFDTNAFVLDASGFSNNLNDGVFSIATSGNDIILRFTTANPVSVPANFVSTAAGKGTFQGSPNTTYSIRYTDTLDTPITWQLLTTVTTDGNGVGTFADPSAPNGQSTRYYRVTNP